MKKLIIAILSLFVITSCNNAEKNNTKNNAQSSAQTDSSEIYKQEAINTLNEIDRWVKKGVTKQVSNAEVNKVINPLMEKYKNLLSKLNIVDSTELHEYRLKQINEMIDLQMSQK